MNHPIRGVPARPQRPFQGVLALTLTLMLTLAAATAAQAHGAAAAPKADPLDPKAAVPAPVYRSAFEGYKPYTDEIAGNWKEANDTVGKIGGWRVYARQAREPDAAAGNAASTRPEPAKSMPGSHLGHGGKP